MLFNNTLLLWNSTWSCSAIFRTRIDEARIKLSFAEKRIQEYDDLGPEMETIFAAYAGILDEIDKTEDDICKIRQSRWEERKFHVIV